MWTIKFRKMSSIPNLPDFHHVTGGVKPVAYWAAVDQWGRIQAAVVKVDSEWHAPGGDYYGCERDIDGGFNMLQWCLHSKEEAFAAIKRRLGVD